MGHTRLSSNTTWYRRTGGRTPEGRVTHSIRGKCTSRRLPVFTAGNCRDSGGETDEAERPQVLASCPAGGAPQHGGAPVPTAETESPARFASTGRERLHRPLSREGTSGFLLRVGSRTSRTRSWKAQRPARSSTDPAFPTPSWPAGPRTGPGVLQQSCFRRAGRRGPAHAGGTTHSRPHSSTHRLGLGPAAAPR